MVYNLKLKNNKPTSKIKIYHLLVNKLKIQKNGFSKIKNLFKNNLPFKRRQTPKKAFP